jgi:hypothetical protein
LEKSSSWPAKGCSSSTSYYHKCIRVVCRGGECCLWKGGACGSLWCWW